MKVFFHDDCLLHNPPYEILSGKLVPYLECPSRLSIIKQVLLENPDYDFELSNELDFFLDLRKYMLKVHRPDYLDYLETAYDAWVGSGGDEVKTAVLPETFAHISLVSKYPIDPSKLSTNARAGLYCYDLSCPITKDTYKATLGSLRVTLTAARALTCLRPGDGIFALCRPPGHHAAHSICGGYCFINNVAVAARFLQSLSEKVTKVAILDIDYHHGNGTQEAFYDDSSVLYVSLHADGDYPYFTGSAEETGNAEGKGFNVNLPLPRGTTGDGEYCSALSRAVLVVKKFEPTYLIISLGVDTHIDDPICDFLLTTEGYLRVGSLIAAIHRPTLFVMEGGYHMDSLGQNVRNVLKGFQDEASQ